MHKKGMRFFLFRGSVDMERAHEMCPTAFEDGSSKYETKEREMRVCMEIALHFAYTKFQNK